MVSKAVSIQLIIGAVLGSVIACSPTKFNQSTTANTLCDSSVNNCVIQGQSVDIVQNFKVGSGKVDILFVNDNSASMSKTQVALASKFAGFIQNLDSKNIDYRIAITTTDLAAVQRSRLVPFSNGKYYLTNADSNRVTLFNNAIVRSETINCEDFIISMFNTHGPSFQTHSNYHAQYSTVCPSSDTRGIYTANMVVSENAQSFMRSDANLNLILISNDNVRQGNAMEERDRASTFTAMMNSSYPTKYWDFNSIVVKDETCRQSQTLRNTSGQIVSNAYGPAIAGGIGLEYANLSNSAARDIDNNPRPRGKILSICESNYSNHFNTMATQITDDARMFTMRCTPSVAPVVTLLSDNSAVPHTWNGDKIVFARAYAGVQVKIAYSCYTGPT